MNQVKVTRNYHKLPFNELSPERFDDLCFHLISRLERFDECSHYGRSGADGGIDILATERLDSGKVKKWMIQCKRIKEMRRRVLKSVVDEIKLDSIPQENKLLLMTSCSASRKMREFFKDYSEKNGFKEPSIWDFSNLEALILEHKDLLAWFFDIGANLVSNIEKSVALENMKLFKKLKADFYRKRYPSLNRLDVEGRPSEKFWCSKVLIRSIHDNNRDECIEIKPRVYSGHSYEPYNLRSNGFELIITGDTIGFDETHHWDILTYDSPQHKEKYKLVKCFRVGLIPYENIIEYDLDGDECHAYPIIFCNYSFEFGPFKEFKFYPITESGKLSEVTTSMLDISMRKNFRKNMDSNCFFPGF